MSAKATWILVDSSAWIFALRKDGIEHIRRRVDQLLDSDRIATCGLVGCELLGGAKTRKEFDRLEREFGGLHQLSLDDEAWRSAAQVNFRMAQAGRPVPVADCVIAGAALRYAVPLAHADEHMDWIAKETGLKVESYVHIVRRLKSKS